MSIAGVAHIAAGSSTDANSYTTASITPTANRLQLAAVAAGKSGTVTQPTLTGNGLTWTFVTRVDHDTSGTFASLFLFRAMGASPSAGTAAIAFGGVTHLACCWAFDEFSGVDTSGTDGSGAIVQSVGEAETDLGNTALVTLAAFSSVDNGTYGCLANQVAASHTQGSGFTKLGDTSTPTPAIGLMTQWKAGNDTTVDASWVTTGEKSGIIGVELKAAVVAGAAHSQAVVIA
jgi:hypothetical protein